MHDKRQYKIDYVHRTMWFQVRSCFKVTYLSIYGSYMFIIKNKDTLKYICTVNGDMGMERNRK